ncbi:MAG: arsenate reductase ArsC [Parvibaculales bacterium]
MKNVLFLCTGNSCRSIMAEAYLNHIGDGRFKAYSAGSAPTGNVHPMAIKTLENEGLTTPSARSKSWDEFAGLQAPTMDFIMTVCDNAAGEVCPIWPGHPATHHWPFPDPAAFLGNAADTQAHFEEVFGLIKQRIHEFVGRP